MSRGRRILKKIVIAIVVLYGTICLAVFLFQEKLIFFPVKLPAGHEYRFDHPFTELFLESRTGNRINALHFRNDSSKGLILYFHGNAGSLDSWGRVSGDFLPAGYDVLIFDYASYGKSTGKLSEENIFEDAQTVYDFAKASYPEGEIILYGRSLGTGVAAHLASQNNPLELILESPFFSMRDVSQRHYPFLPSFLLRYPFRTDLVFQKIKSPVTILHGTEDEVIYFESSLKLKVLFKPGDTLYIVNGGHHNDLGKFPEYKIYLSEILR